MTLCYTPNADRKMYRYALVMSFHAGINITFNPVCLWQNTVCYIQSQCYRAWFLLFLIVYHGFDPVSLSLSLSLLGERTYKDTDELRQLAIGITVTDDKSLGGSAEK